MIRSSFPFLLLFLFLLSPFTLANRVARQGHQDEAHQEEVQEEGGGYQTYYYETVKDDQYGQGDDNVEHRPPPPPPPEDLGIVSKLMAGLFMLTKIWGGSEENHQEEVPAKLEKVDDLDLEAASDGGHGLYTMGIVGTFGLGLVGWSLLSSNRDLLVMPGKKKKKRNVEEEDEGESMK